MNGVMMIKITVLLILATLLSCVGDDSNSSNEGKGGEGASVTLGINQPLAINRDNESGYVLEGSCPNDGEEIRVNLSGILVEPSPVCENNIWRTVPINTELLPEYDDLPIIVTGSGGSSAIYGGVVKDTTPPEASLRTSPGVINSVNQQNFTPPWDCSEEGLQVSVSVGDRPVGQAVCRWGEWDGGLNLEGIVAGDPQVEVVATVTDAAGNRASHDFYGSR